jgi:flagellar hook-associated protein 2
MASISSAGVGSGLDVNTLVSQLVAAEGDPQTKRLDKSEAEYQAKLTSYGTLKGALASFENAAAALTNLSSFQVKNATVSNAEKLAASATSVASAGNYSINVTQLAQSHALASAASFSSVSDSLGTGTLTFRFGTTQYDSGTDTYTSFSENPDKPSKQVVIEDASLQGIRDAVNNAKIGVTASLVHDGSGYRLLFVSDDSGADSSLQISVAEDGASPTNTDTSGLSQLAFNASATNLQQTVAAQDANLSVNGLDITSATNTVTGAIHGVTLNLLAETGGTPVQVSVQGDQTNVTTAVQKFVKTYNELIDSIHTLSGYDPATGQSGILIGDATVRGIANEVRRVLGEVVNTDGGPYQSLADIGITTQPVNQTLPDGTQQLAGSLVLDGEKLQTALANDPSAVGKLFGAGGTPSDSLVNYAGATSATQVGTFGVEISQVATHGSYVGAGGVASVTLDSSNNAFAINIDGAQSNTITLTAGTYDTAQKLSDLANEIQGRINTDSALSKAGKSVAVIYDSGSQQFVITSNSYGSSSAVKVTAENADLGLQGGTETDGLDVAGTIGGSSATGSGRYLTGTGAAAGLQIEINGGNAGLRGSVVFSRGVADRLKTLLDGYLGDNGIIASRTEGTQESIDRISQQRADLAEHLKSVEYRYRAQFTALDTLLSRLKSTSDFLTQQLASLNSSTNG